METEAVGDGRDLIAWLRNLGPRYGFALSLLVPHAGEGALTLVLVAPTPEEGACGDDVRRQAHLLVQEATRLSAGTREPGFTFTRAELDVLRWIRAGRSNRDIARILCKSEFTVKTHIQNMLQKSGLDNRVQLARLSLPEYSSPAQALLA
jgi:DNA-binding CsgD family transcriptional regulator